MELDSDYLDGGAGDDLFKYTILEGDTNDGDDTLIGGDGIDTADYSNSASNKITVNLGDQSDVNSFGTITVAGSSGTDTLNDHIEIINGSSVADTFNGYAGTPTLPLLNFNDTFNGGSGNDVLNGGIGDDVLNGGSGNDRIEGGAGNDVIDGGSDFDRITFLTSTEGVNVNLSLAASAFRVIDDGFGTQDIVTGVNNITSSSHNDILKGNTSTNYITAGEGDDTIFVTSGSDYIDGSEGNESGGDWIYLEDLNTIAGVNDGLKASLSTATSHTVGTGSVDSGISGNATLSNIENIKGSTRNDELHGDNANNTLDGNDGDDTLYGYDGADVLIGGAGDDTFMGGKGIDTYDGGVGSNTISFYTTNSDPDQPSNVEVDLSQGKIINDGFGNEETSLTLIQNLQGSRNADKLTGDDSDNIISGYHGKDIIYGLGGKDTLYGEYGNDTIYTGAGEADLADGGSGDDTLGGGLDKDTLIGGTGQDTLDYTASSKDLIINLSDVTSGYSKVIDASTPTKFDYVKEISNIRSGSGDDILGGTSGYNNIKAGDGDDTIYLSAGSDNLYGEGGKNWISLENYAPTVEIDLANNLIGASTISNIENIIDKNDNVSTTIWGTTNNNTFIMYDGNDNIIGRNGSDVYDLGAGDDVAHATRGNDTLIGGSGTDTLNYRTHISNQANTIILENTSIDGTAYSTSIVNINIEGLSTLADGTYSFLEVKDGDTNTDYLYHNGSVDFENYSLSTLR